MHFYNMVIYYLEKYYKITTYSMFYIWIAKKKIIPALKLVKYNIIGNNSNN